MVRAESLTVAASFFCYGCSGSEISGMLCKVLFVFIKHITEECQTCQVNDTVHHNFSVRGADDAVQGRLIKCASHCVVRRKTCRAKALSASSVPTTRLG